MIAISIHAPRTGSDPSASDATKCEGHFNPRSPHGERLGKDRRLRGVPYFNPRSPHGERLNMGARTVRLNIISIHAPRTGSDQSGFYIEEAEISISIHAPRTGSDRWQVGLHVRQGYFNPRSPHGERRQLLNICTISKVFQSTLPARGATTSVESLAMNIIFQSTLPARGATAQHPDTLAEGTFQSTLPARGATRRKRSKTLKARYFNPRSPHGERHLLLPPCPHPRHFNPRSPHGERRYSLTGENRAITISIHAPRTGSDTGGATW